LFKTASSSRIGEAVLFRYVNISEALVAQPSNPSKSGVIATQSISRSLWIAIREAVVGQRHLATDAVPSRSLNAPRAATPQVAATHGGQLLASAGTQVDFDE
jgi:hypothetical protein